MNKSYTKMTAEEVKKLSKETMKNIDKERERRKEENKKYDALPFWKKFIGHQFYNTEFYYLPEIYAWADYDTAENLLRLAEKTCDGYVMVSAEDLRAIK